MANRRRSSKKMTTRSSVLVPSVDSQQDSIPQPSPIDRKSQAKITLNKFFLGPVEYRVFYGGSFKCVLSCVR